MSRSNSVRSCRTPQSNFSSAGRIVDHPNRIWQSLSSLQAQADQMELELMLVTSHSDGECAEDVDAILLRELEEQMAMMQRQLEVLEQTLTNKEPHKMSALREGTNQSKQMSSIGDVDVVISLGEELDSFRHRLQELFLLQPAAMPPRRLPPVSRSGLALEDPHEKGRRKRMPPLSAHAEPGNQGSTASPRTTSANRGRTSSRGPRIASRSASSSSLGPGGCLAAANDCTGRWREATLEELKAEVEKERHEYIERRLREIGAGSQVLCLSRTGLQRSTSRASTSCRSRSLSRGGRGTSVPRLEELRHQLQQERGAFLMSALQSSKTS